MARIRRGRRARIQGPKLGMTLIFRLLGATDIQYAYLLSYNPTIESAGMLELVRLFSSPDISQAIEVMQHHQKQPE